MKYVWYTDPVMWVLIVTLVAILANVGVMVYAMVKKNEKPRLYTFMRRWCKWISSALLGLCLLAVLML